MRTIPASELVIHSDGSVFHLHLKPEQLADRVVLVGDPARVTTVASYFDSQECEVSSREFHTITGQYKGKRITVVSHGIGTDNIDIVLNELDALANIDFSTVRSSRNSSNFPWFVSGLPEGYSHLSRSGLMWQRRNRSDSTGSFISTQIVIPFVTQTWSLN